MPDNVMKAVIDAIAEEDNEIGGHLVTRLLGVHKFGRNDAYLETANPTRISAPTGSAWFASAVVGDEFDLISGTFVGRYTVLTIDPSGDFVTVEILGGGAPSFTDEDPVRVRLATLKVESTFGFPDPAVTLETGRVWAGYEDARVTYGALQTAPGDMEFQQLGDPTTGEGYLTADARAELEVLSQDWSGLELLRRALLVDYAEGVDLDRVGRNLAVVRPRGTSDAIMRSLIKVLAYLPRGTIYALELVLEAFFPGGGYTNENIPYPAPVDKWLIYEDRVGKNNTVYILPPTLAEGSVSEGRAFWSKEEEATATATTTVDVAITPITVKAIRLRQVYQELEMVTQPSGDTPAWTYSAEGGAAAEGAIFGGSTGALTHTVAGAPSSSSGRYYRTVADLAAPSRYQDWEIATWWRRDSSATVNGYPWHVRVRDGEAEVLLEWDADRFRLGGVAVGSATLLTGSTDWHQVKLARRGAWVYASVDGVVLASALASSFASTASTDFSFGYFDQAAANQDWTVWWDRVRVRVDNGRNWWNYWAEDADLTVGDAWIDDPVNTPFVAGDTDKRVRIFSANPENDGEWLATYSSTSRLLLAGIERADAALAADGSITIEDPIFRPLDVGKTVTISGSALGNDGDHVITEWITAYTVKTATTFAVEGSQTWKFKPVFVAETSVEYELIDAGTVATKTLTARQAWPAAAQLLDVDYTTVWSAQLLLNEFVRNEGSGGTPPAIYYPFYLFDVSAALRQVIDEVTAAGVIPEFFRQ